jgi:hypothetical protein
MSIKLEKAIAKKRVVVKGNISGEVMLHVLGQTVTVARGQEVNLTEMVGNPKDLLKVGGLKESLKQRRLVLV